jgi:hypothetical protein
MAAKRLRYKYGSDVTPELPRMWTQVVKKGRKCWGCGQMIEKGEISLRVESKGPAQRKNNGGKRIIVKTEMAYHPKCGIEKVAGISRSLAISFYNLSHTLETTKQVVSPGKRSKW